MNEPMQWEHQSSVRDFRYAQTLRDNCVLGIFHGTLDQLDAEAVIELVETAAKVAGGVVGYVVDVSSLEHVSPSARRTMTDFTNADSSPVGILGVAGGNFFIRSIFNLFLRVSTIPAKVLADQEAAMTWVRERITAGDLEKKAQRSGKGRA